jgi:putative membrane protein
MKIEPILSSRKILAAAMALGLLGGCNQTSGVAEQDELANGSATVAKHYAGPKPEGVSSTNDAVTTTFYVPQAAMGDMYEIQTSEMALVRAKSPEVKAFAQKMISDHKKSSEALRKFVADNPVNIAIPKNLDGRRLAMLSNLESATDEAFDAEYMGQQAAAHQEALNLHGSYSRNGDYPALKTLAQDVVKVVEHHSETANKLAQKFGPPS